MAQLYGLPFLRARILFGDLHRPFLGRAISSRFRICQTGKACARSRNNLYHLRDVQTMRPPLRNGPVPGRASHRVNSPIEGIGLCLPPSIVENAATKLTDRKPSRVSFLLDSGVLVVDTLHVRFYTRHALCVSIEWRYLNPINTVSGAKKDWPARCGIALAQSIGVCMESRRGDSTDRRALLRGGSTQRGAFIVGIHNA